MSEPHFLTLDEVLGIHADQIRVYGGANGLRDLALLRSAIAMPETSFDGEYLHPSVFEDGGRLSLPPGSESSVRRWEQADGADVRARSLGLNGQRLRADPDDLYSLVDGAAAGAVDKAEVSVFLRRHCVAR